MALMSMHFNAHNRNRHSTYVRCHKPGRAAFKTYWGPPDLRSADPTGMQVLADLSQAIAALVIVPT